MKQNRMQHPSRRNKAKHSLRHLVFHVIDRGDAAPSLANRIFEVAVVCLILLNVLAVVLASFAELYQKQEKLFDTFELVSVILFTIEYGLRLLTARLKYPELSPTGAYLRYVLSFAAIIDFAAILPFYLPLAVPLDLRFLRIIRVTRILRVVKLQRYSDSLQLVGRVFRSRSKELLVTIGVTFMLLLIAASVMYHLENGAQPEKFPNIIASLCWAIATLTTVGYGDIFPITIGGKILGGIMALLGIGLVALPAGIISSGFMEELNKKKAHVGYDAEKCPHCGMDIHKSA